MDKRFRSIAILQRHVEDQLQILLSWNEADNDWRFISGERLERESFRETASREVAWQLKLNRNRDFLVSNMALLCMEYVEEIPTGGQRHVAVAFFTVHLYGQQARARIEQNRGLRWVSAAEVCRGTTADGGLIDPPVVDWINQWRVIQPWH